MKIVQIVFHCPIFLPARYLGYTVYSSYPSEYFFAFDIPKFEGTQLYVSLVEQGLGMSFEDFEAPIDFVHKKIMGEWLVWILILGHVLAAMFHHFIKKDRTLEKMTISKNNG